MRRFITAFLFSLVALVAAFKTSNLFAKVRFASGDCADPLSWGQHAVEVSAVSAVLALVCGLAIAIFAPRWRVVLIGTATAFTALVLLFAGASLIAAVEPFIEFGCAASRHRTDRPPPPAALEVAGKSPPSPTKTRRPRLSRSDSGTGGGSKGFASNPRCRSGPGGSGVVIVRYAL